VLDLAVARFATGRQVNSRLIQISAVVGDERFIKRIQTDNDIVVQIWRFAMNYTMLTADGDTYLKIVTVSLILSIAIA
jgi:hypothetical protein